MAERMISWMWRERVEKERDVERVLARLIRSFGAAMGNGSSMSAVVSVFLVCPYL